MAKASKKPKGAPRANKRLSYKARGILAYILSRQGKWEVRLNDIIHHSDHDGRCAVQAAMKELVDCGYAALKIIYAPESNELAGKRYVILRRAYVPKELPPDEQKTYSSGNNTVAEPNRRKPCLYTRSEEVRTTSKKEELHQEKEKELRDPPTPLPPTDDQQPLDFAAASWYAADLLATQEPWTNGGVERRFAARTEVARVEEDRGEGSEPPEEPSQPLLTIPGVSEFVGLYNLLMPDGHPRVEKITPGRAAKVNAYLKTFPALAYWEKAFGAVAASAFLQGKRNNAAHQGFKGDFDWFLQKGKDGIENCQKAYEGKYCDSPDAVALLSGQRATANRSLIERHREYTGAQ